MAGYSTKSLAAKLSLKAGQRVWWRNMPKDVRATIEADGLALKVLKTPAAPLDAAHVFVKSRADLEMAVATARGALAPDGFIWVSWPKKSSGVATDVTENTVREVALPTGLVDVKVCAVDDVWSGLKLMIRRELRDTPAKPSRTRNTRQR
jgi:hypothetical protein